MKHCIRALTFPLHSVTNSMEARASKQVLVETLINEIGFVKKVNKHLTRSLI